MSQKQKPTAADSLKQTIEEDVRSCRVCGCTDDHACVDTDLGPCWWVEDDLCSHCSPDITNFKEEVDRTYILRNKENKTATMSELSFNLKEQYQRYLQLVNLHENKMHPAQLQKNLQ